jgi:hypothetical protein
LTKRAAQLPPAFFREVIAERKGVAVWWGLKEARSKQGESMYKNRAEA